MQRGNQPVLVFDEAGEIFAISTGADATTEHEQGSKPLQEALCNLASGPQATGVLRKVGEACGLVDPAPRTDNELIAALRAGKPVSYPPLLERKAISRNLDQLRFYMDREGDEPIAVFGYAPCGDRVAEQLDSLRLYGSDLYAGAWEQSSFVIKVRTVRLVAKLKRFAERVRAGDGIFAGTFLERHGDNHLSGVIIALRSGLRAEHQQEIEKAQREWEAGLRLKARSRLPELNALCRDQANGRHARLPGYVWPVWREGVDSDVVYAVNPDSDRYAPYYGPYTFEALKDWILAEQKYQLVPITREREGAST